jgi:uncharacterized protein YbcV (DUF1398 family)
MTVLNIDTIVEFGDPNQKKVNGWITAVNIRKTNVLYEISYWLLDDLKCIWLPEHLLTIKDSSKKIKIGFTTNG